MKLKRWLVFRPWERHSLVLMIGGLVYILIGISFKNIEEISSRQEVSLAVALRMFPLETWGFIFIATGLLAILSSKWPSFNENWGYGVLTGLAAAWAAIFFFGFFTTRSPLSNIVSGFVWSLLAFLWWGVSGLLNPPKKVVKNDSD